MVFISRLRRFYRRYRSGACKRYPAGEL